MEADIPLGWKPLNLEWYDRTTDPDEHLDAFLTQANLYTNDNAILCCVFPMSLKGVALTWYGGLLQGPFIALTLLSIALMRNMQPSNLIV